jgi:acyl-coenzyme A synthetase/AMP-(fatty) acid ligase/acyl carrier protein
VQDVERFKERFSPGCILVNGFGQSEYSFSLLHFADHETEVTGHAVPIGYPVDGTEVALLDAEGHPGQLFGEIAIRSTFLAPGYWGRPEQSAAVFHQEPGDANSQTYRTGDLARLRADGAIEFVGRKDFQVKIRGHRVELGEIETALRRHPGVENAVAVARSSPENETQLTAYIVPSNRESARTDQLREFLAKGLPDYMIPSAMVMLDAVPLTSHGKIDRQALPIPRDTPHQPVQPRTPFEIALAEIWKDVLRVDQVSISDDFFARGGHSLIATRLVSQIRDQLDVEVPLRAIFEKRTIEKLALYIAELHADAGIPDEIEKLFAELESLP